VHRTGQKSSFVILNVISDVKQNYDRMKWCKYEVLHHV